MSHQEALTAYLAAFVAELVKAGVEDVVISPGSRSTPIAMIMAKHPQLRIHVQVDERSAAYFALGIAKARRQPTAILCTSGTAAANYYPAIIEASISRVPLLVLTADRPHELRDVGAPQAIDQIHLYGNNVKWFVEMAPPENSKEMIRYARTVCARAVATAKGQPSGPVHLNFPIREPLIPTIDEGLFKEDDERPNQYISVHTGTLTLNEKQLSSISKDLEFYRKGVIICGPLDGQEFSSALMKLAAKLNIPVLADPLSQLRSGRHTSDLIIDCYDTFLRNEAAKTLLKPDIIIRFGALPVSKALSIFLKENHDVRQLVIDEGAGWRDPGASATEMIYCNEADFCLNLIRQIDGIKTAGNLAVWQNINQITKRGLSAIESVDELSEGKLFHQLAEQLPEGAALFVGNSMPIRDLDSFFFHNNKEIRIFANRGANGIDGIVSTALGAATACQPMYLILGDLTFYHDFNGLLAAKLYELNIHIILINNNGGGIFSFLPQSSHQENFELLFGTPLGIDFKHIVEMYNGSYELISDWHHFNEAMRNAPSYSGLKVLEVSTSRENNVLEHRELWNRVSQEINLYVNGEI
ncbi:2-succinyl-5-enolpyruvyl-6-hydroxy-3-cyclohexene-1-carboxylic-acid synthase [Mesobacillus harenae]|uniref:2-succinyl-5-enolpyruvyl-6-hydroxy-3- cyclohexene-1-carboxylic-acid synthase n=1 Tax=Mesobacillus harenae TaxID=2213203 RepID=UPI001580DF9E|nr:2-succinyl-5-enolpyruvyl-6-hydroxy-3-cyclohexene-1-carboxylic-acid synthase [Mesobacillus harenae]